MTLKIKDSMEGLRPDPSLVEDTRKKMLEAARFAKARERRTRRLHRTAALLSAAAALLVISFGLTSAWRHMTVSTYYLDINPSFSIAADREGSVNAVTALNDDAAALLDLSALKGTAVTECVNAIVSAAAEAGYFSESTVSVVSLALAEGEPGAEMLVRCAEEVESGSGNIAVFTSTVDASTVASARSAGVSPGKMNLAGMVSGLDGDTSADDWLSAPVTEIFDRLEELTAAPGTPEAENAAERIRDVVERRRENAPGLPAGGTAPAEEPQDGSVPGEASRAIPEEEAASPSPVKAGDSPLPTPDAPDTSAPAAEGSPEARDVLPGSGEGSAAPPSGGTQTAAAAPASAGSADIPGDAEKSEGDRDAAAPAGSVDADAAGAETPEAAAFVPDTVSEAQPPMDLLSSGGETADLPTAEGLPSAAADSGERDAPAALPPSGEGRDGTPAPGGGAPVLPGASADVPLPSGGRDDAGDPSSAAQSDAGPSLPADEGGDAPGGQKPM